MATRARITWGTLLIALGVLNVAACASSPPLTPTAAQTKPIPATESANPALGVAKPTAAPDAEWKVEWEKTVAAAKNEGKLALVGAAGDSWRSAAFEFNKAYPDIQIDYFAAVDPSPTVLAERRGGVYTRDVYVGGVGAMLESMIPDGSFATLRPALILPEVVDDSKWNLGFNDGFLDKEKKYAYMFMGYLTSPTLVNRKVAPESELKTYDDLLNPKWKGQLAWGDPRTPGSGMRVAQNLLYVKGEDWLRKLLAQDVLVFSDYRRILEGLVRGNFVAGLGVRSPDLAMFKEQGAIDNIVPLEPDTPAGAYLTGGSGHVALMNNAPHPNAAKVFINWLLSEEGQKIHVQYTGLNTRRLGIEGPADTRPKPGVKYMNSGSEENSPIYERAGEIAKEVIK